MKNRMNIFKSPALAKVAFVFAFSASGLLSAQQIQRTCATMENNQRLMDENPDLQDTRKSIEEHTQNFLSAQATHKTNVSAMGTVYRIPVVVHVVYNTTAQNITDGQIQSQIDVLNEDFRRLNADKINTPSAFSTLAADCEIEFCLASVAPNGAATTGIVRRQTTVTAFSQNDAMKFTAQGGSDAWDATKYLNLWVCNLGGSLLGYAQFPGGPASTDGVVINYKYFGRNGSAVAPFNKGRTATHEVGHWLNLYHIWGDDGTACTGSDQVSDTPNQAGEHYGCPSFPSVSCSNGPNGAMFMDYMDYTDDACMNMFSAGQKNRMRALFAAGGSKASLLTSPGCGGTVAAPAYCSANGASTQYEYINNVTLNTINNTTTASAGGYGNYTSMSTSLAKGAAYTITLKPGFTGSAYSEYFKVYIDFNGDLDFADAGENVYSSAATQVQVSASITIPTTAITGSTRMRILMSDAAPTSSCGSLNYGEVEDYTVNLTTSTTTSCGTPSGLFASSITSSSATLQWGAVSGATSYNVRYRKVATTTWTTTSSTSTSKAISGLTAGTGYEFQVQAMCSAAGVYSASSNFTTTSTTPTVSASTVTVGTGTTTTTTLPYSSYYMDQRSQIIITKNELVAGGWTSVNSYLRSLALYVTTASSQTLNGFTIKVAHTTAASFASTSFLTGSFTTVYSGNVVATANSWNTYTFTSGFLYDGTSNLLVEICWNNSSYTTNSSVQFTATTAYQAISYRADVAGGGVCANTTGTRTLNRPNVRMVFKSSATGKFSNEDEEDGLVAAADLSEIVVFPNPANNEVNVSFVSDDNAPVMVRIIDMTGRIVLEQPASSEEGTNTISVITSALENGNYILFIERKAELMKKRLVIAR